MAGIRREDLTMKLPALFHLSRLGYVWFSPESFLRDRETNILPSLLRSSLERINGRSLSDDSLARLLRDLRDLLNQPDLGHGFYRVLRNGWNGWKLLDQDRPDRNSFSVTSELLCVHGSSRFRPDITLFVNGLPLAMLEVKAGNQSRGIRAEYDRMRKRFRNSDFRRFLQCVQVWVFSDDHPASPDRLLPEEGSFYATGAREDFPIYAFREKHPSLSRPTSPVDLAARSAILAAFGLKALPREKGVRSRRSSSCEFHRLLTGVFAPDRFLFLLRYAIQYAEVQDETGKMTWTKRLLTSDQFFALWDLRRKWAAGFRTCSLSPGGTAGEDAFFAAAVSLLRDLSPGAEIIRLCPDGSSLVRAMQGCSAHGVSAVRFPDPRSGAVVLAVQPDSAKKSTLFDTPHPASCRFYLCSGQSEAEVRLLRRLRRRDPDAFWIILRSEIFREGASYTYLLECADGTFYCGWTNDLKQRVRAHNEGKGAKYTRSRRPVRLVYSESFPSREEAMSREWHVKRLSRLEKVALIQKGKAEST